MRGHLSHDAGFVDFRGTAKYRLEFGSANLIREAFVKTEPDVKIKAARESKLTVGCLRDWGASFCAFAGVFDEVKITDNCDYIPLVKIS